MQRLTLSALLCACSVTAAHAQDLYFPPLAGDAWETVDPADLGWCPENIDSLYGFLGDRHTKAFLLLKDGRIVLEHYFGTFTADSLWYWASAGKTLTSTLVGIAQEEGFLDIGDPTSDHLGTGWTSAPPDKEALITVRHQLTMTTGLDDGGNVDCTLPTCLDYLADAGTRWAYHNAPYTLLDQVVANATGSSFASYFNSRIRDRIGMDGFWLPVGGNNVYFSHARSMARYGLLALGGMVWDQDTILHDMDYFTAATTPSQDLNDSYGYLWWLNGQPSFMVPTLQVVFPGPLMPHAPADMFCALGKNDQLLNVVPSAGWVLVRMGDPAYTSQSVAIVLNDQIWQRISALACTSTDVPAAASPDGIGLWPNPCTDRLALHLPGGPAGWQAAILDADGRTLRHVPAAASLDVTDLPAGPYALRLTNGAQVRTYRFMKR
ncbi:MAG: serine hydrolase [Bacteroidetes bacterium]|nr:serine hydrolase [Bacteroidota bacterium]